MSKIHIYFDKTKLFCNYFYIINIRWQVFEVFVPFEVFE